MQYVWYRFGSPAKAGADPEEIRKLDEIKTMVATVAGQLSARPVAITPVQEPFRSPGALHSSSPISCSSCNVELMGFLQKTHGSRETAKVFSMHTVLATNLSSCGG